MRRTNVNDPDGWSDVASFTAEPVEANPRSEPDVHNDHTHVHIIPTAGAIGRWPEPGVRSGRTYGANAGTALSRLASKAVIVFALAMLAFVLFTAGWVIFSDAVPTPQPKPTTPAVSPHLR